MSLSASAICEVLRFRSATLSLTLAFSLVVPAIADAQPSFDAVRGDRYHGWLGQTRSELVARNGVVATSSPLAAQAGLDILKKGGNAIDAAIATAAVLNVVEPESAGIGGDAFALVWLAKEKKLVAMNASGRAPMGATLKHYQDKGYKRVPEFGIDSVTVPGAVDGWDALLKRAGTMTFKQVLEPAARIAEEGFGVSERIQIDWTEGVKQLSADPDSARAYLINGQAPAAYSIFRNPDLGRAFRILQAQGRDAFYKGPIAQAIVAKSKVLGGTITMEDLANTHASWVTPISTNYHGYDVYELPPNTQGFAVLEMLNILDVCASALGYDLKTLGPKSAEFFHLLIEAKKIAYLDLDAYDGDPDFSRIATAKLISKEYARAKCASIDLHHASPLPQLGGSNGGTVYVTTADRWGNMVSFIYSVYDTFGSNVTVPGFGFVLQDRGALFSLDPNSPNVIAPGKRPFHTLIPAFVMKDGKPQMSFGLMGGDQQAQGQAQVLVDMIDLGANLQAASDAARFTHQQFQNMVFLESPLYDLIGAQLKAMGHDVGPPDGADMGGYQAIWFDAAPGKSPPVTGKELPTLNGVYRAASDHRKDGEAVGW